MDLVSSTSYKEFKSLEYLEEKGGDSHAAYSLPRTPFRNTVMHRGSSIILRKGNPIFKNILKVERILLLNLRRIRVYPQHSFCCFHFTLFIPEWLSLLPLPLVITCFGGEKCNAHTSRQHTNKRSTIITLDLNKFCLPAIATQSMFLIPDLLAQSATKRTRYRMEFRLEAEETPFAIEIAIAKQYGPG